MSQIDAWMPLWIGPYLADTQHLTRDEHGGYLLLLMAYWRNRGPLPDDDRRLAAICKATPAEWKRLRPTLAEFFTVAGGTWTQKRMQQELGQADEKHRSAAEKARKAAEARWGKSDARSIPQAVPEDVHKECPAPTPTQGPSEEQGQEPRFPHAGNPSSVEKPRTAGEKNTETREDARSPDGSGIPSGLPVVVDPTPKGRGRRTLRAECPPDVPRSVWDDWHVVRKDKRAGPVTQTALDGIRAEATRARMSLADAITTCCRRAWVGFQADWVSSTPARSGRASAQDVNRDAAAAFLRYDDERTIDA